MQYMNIYIGVKGKDQRYSFLAIILDENNNESEYYEEIKESTPNKAIMLGISNILNKMEDNLNINIFLQTNIGFESIRKLLEGKSLQKWENRDNGIKIRDAIKSKNLDVNFKEYKDCEEVEVIKSLSKRLNQYNINSNLVVNVEDGIYNPSNERLTRVNIYVGSRVEYMIEENRVQSIVVLEYMNEGKVKEAEFFDEDKNTTYNRMVIQSIIYVMKILKQRHINLYTHSPIGLASYNKYRSGTNKDLIKEVFDVMIEKGHSLKEFKSTEEKQKELEKKLEEKYKTLV